MSQAKDLSQYFEAELSSIKPGQTLAFDVFLYFSRNNHIILWKSKDEVPDAAMMDKLTEKGVKLLYIKNEDKEAFRNYVSTRIEKPQAAAPAAPGPTQVVTAPKAPVVERTQEIVPAKPVAPAPVAGKVVPAFETPEGEKLSKTLADKMLSNAQKKEALKSTSQSMLTQATQSVTDTTSQARADRYAQKTVRDVLNSEERNKNADEVSPLTEMLDQAFGKEEFQYSMNVATYAVLLSMAFGKAEPDLLRDIALAGLLHNVGLAWLTPVEVPKVLTPASEAASPAHIHHTITLIERFMPELLSETVRVMILQHREKFDGSGYPKNLQGFQIDDLAQLLAMATTIETITSGKWDGAKHTRLEAFEAIERTEQNRTFPEFFNPELLATARKWLKDPRSQAATAEAGEVVTKQLESIKQSAKSRPKPG